MPQGAPAKVEWDAKLKVVQQQFAEWHPDRIKTAFDFAIKAPLPMAKVVWKRLCEEGTGTHLNRWHEQQTNGKSDSELIRIEDIYERAYKSIRPTDRWLVQAFELLPAVRDLYSKSSSERARGVIGFSGYPGPEKQPESEDWLELAMCGIDPNQPSPSRWLATNHRNTLFEVMANHRWEGRSSMFLYLDKSDDKLAISTMLKLAKDDNAFVRKGAIVELGAMEAKDVRIDQAIVSSLRSKWAVVRYSAISSAKYRKSPGAEVDLRRLTSDPNEKISTAAQAALKTYINP